MLDLFFDWLIHLLPWQAWLAIGVAAGTLIGLLALWMHFS